MLKNESKKKLCNSELYVGIFMLVFAIVLLWQICTIKVPASRIFPIMVLIIIVASCIMQFYSALTGRRSKDVKQVLIKPKEWILLGVLLLSYPLYQLLGFYSTLFLVVLSVSLVTVYPFTKKNILFSFLYSIGIILICYVCFYFLLGLITPVGVLI